MPKIIIPKAGHTAGFRWSLSVGNHLHTEPRMGQAFLPRSGLPDVSTFPLAQYMRLLSMRIHQNSIRHPIKRSRPRAGNIPLYREPLAGSGTTASRIQASIDLGIKNALHSDTHPACLTKGNHDIIQLISTI